MDVTVSVHDWKSLSQSEIIVRHLYAILQIGQTVRKGSGLSIYNADFRSGSAEIPLILSIKNSQTETTMYVRNIPMSAVLERGGLRERWLAVYPPGDPQNLHFDPFQVPREGSPQVCLSVAVHEDLLPTVANVPAAPWDSCQAELDEPGRAPGAAFQRGNLLQVAGGSQPGSRGSRRGSEIDLAPWPSINPTGVPATAQGQKQVEVELDAWLKEKERQAQKIKEHVEDMAKAQRRAEDVGRSLQEQLELLAELRRQSRSAEAVLVDAKLQVQDLERERDGMQREEAELRAQIGQRDAEFQDLRSKRDAADRELSRALAEQGLQRNNLEASSKSFQVQAQVIAGDIEQSKRQVLELKSRLLGKQAILEDHQKTIRMEETVRLEQQAVKRLQLENELDITKSSLAKAQAGSEVSKRQLHDTEGKCKATSKRLETVEDELRRLRSEDADSHPVRATAADAMALLQQKQSKLIEEERKVGRLKQDLKESRELLEQHSNRMAEVHAEATECEMKSKCIEEKKLQLEKDLAARQQKVQESRREKEMRQKQLEAEVARKQAELREAESQMEEMQKTCSELEQTRSLRRTHLEDQTAALQTASARAKELAEELQSTEDDLLRAQKELERLDQEEAERAREVEDARQKLGEVQREMQSMEVQLQPTRVDSLEATSRSLTTELEALLKEQHRAKEEQGKLQTDLEVNEDMLRQSKDELERVSKEQEDAQKEVDRLMDEIKELKGKDRSSRRHLEKSLEDKQKDLDATRGVIATNALEMEALKRVHDSEAEDLRSQLAAIQAANDATERSTATLFAELRTLESRRSEQADALADAEASKASLERDVAKVQYGKETFLQEHSEILERLRDEFAEAKSRLKAASRDDAQAQSRLAAEVQAEAQKCAELREELAARRHAKAGGAGALEESLEDLSGQLPQAQDLARRQLHEEEELRLELQKMKERIRATKEKLVYQDEHLNLQMETLHELEEQRARAEGEVELLTLGLHQQEEENQALLKVNTQLLEEVCKRFGGTLEQWAGSSYEEQVANEVQRYTQQIEMWKQRNQQLRREKTGELSRRNQQHEVQVQTLQQRIDQLQREIMQCNRSVKSWEDEAKRSGKGPTSALPGLTIYQRPLPSNHQRRKALLIGVNYVSSHAPLKGCVNDIWNLQCLLRHTLRYAPEQIQILADGFDGPTRPDRMPSKANILAGLNWLVSGAQPGDHLILAFSGYGCQHPRSPGSEKCESYLVPSDFAAELPDSFFRAYEVSSSVTARIDATSGGALGLAELRRQQDLAVAALGGSPGRYQLVSMLEVHDYISRVPRRCNVTVVLDACYTALPGVGPDAPATFRKVDRGHVEYRKLREFISRPRFLELPPLPMPLTPPELPRSTNLLACTLHCFSGCRLLEWCAEFPIEGTVQGAFSWAFLKAMAQGHFHVGIYQFQQFMAQLLQNLKAHFKHVDQQPVVQLSQDATLQDVVLWT